MKVRPTLYLVVVFVAGFGAIPFAVVNEVMAAAFGQIALAVLTYPLGVGATLAFSALVFLGLATPAEAIAFATPLYAVLGYLWWYRILPKFRS